MTLVAVVIAALGAFQSPPAESQAPPRIASIQIHGNQITSDDEVRTIAGVAVGDPFTTDTLNQVRQRLSKDGRFKDIQVLQRFASITDTSAIALVIVVDEGPVSVERGKRPGEPARVVKRRVLTNVLILPILAAEDGYGFTYGVRLAYVDVGGARGRLSVPLSWGGERQAGLTYERTFAKGYLARLQGGAAIERRVNPAFDTPDTRDRLWARGEGSWRLVRFGVNAERQHVAFGSIEDNLTNAGGDVTFDTRADPAFPRNAVLLRGGLASIWSDAEGRVGRADLEAHGYLGLIGQSVLVLSATRSSYSQGVPPYLELLVGGWSSLRGFEAGAFHGDRSVTGSAELRVPVSSPVSFARLGFSVFADTGMAYGVDQTFRNKDLHTGLGAGVWVSAAAFRAGVAVAHGRGATTRVTFGLGLSF